MKPLFLCCSNICPRGRCHPRPALMVSSVGSGRNRCQGGEGRKAPTPELGVPWDTARPCPSPRREAEVLPTAHPARPPPSPEGAAFPACF